MDKTAAESNLKAERHRNPKIWQEAMTLANEACTITRAFPRDEVWGLTSQLRRAGVSVPSNIAEGSKRSDPDFRKFLTYSLGSLAELDTQFLIAEMQGYAKVHGRAQGEGRRSYGRDPRVLGNALKGLISRNARMLNRPDAQML